MKRFFVKKFETDDLTNTVHKSSGGHFFFLHESAVQQAQCDFEIHVKRNVECFKNYFNRGAT